MRRNGWEEKQERMRNLQMRALMCWVCRFQPHVLQEIWICWRAKAPSSCCRISLDTPELNPTGITGPLLQDAKSCRIQSVIIRILWYDFTKLDSLMQKQKHTHQPIRESVSFSALILKKNLLNWLNMAVCVSRDGWTHSRFYIQWKLSGVPITGSF